MHENKGGKEKLIWTEIAFQDKFGNGQLGRGEGWHRWKTERMSEWDTFFRREKERQKSRFYFSPRRGSIFNALFLKVKGTIVVD